MFHRACDIPVAVQAGAGWACGVVIVVALLGGCSQGSTQAPPDADPGVDGSDPGAGPCNSGFPVDPGGRFIGEDSAVFATGGQVVGPVQASLTDGDLLVLSAERGLQAVDVRDADHPHWEARLPLSGEPMGFFPRGANALVVTRWLRGEELCPDCPGGSRFPQTGRLTLVERAAPDRLETRAQHDAGGRIVAAAILDGRLLLVTNRSPDAASGMLAVEVFGLDGPHLPRIGGAELRGWGHGTSVLVAGRRLYIANAFGSDGGRLRLTVVDIDAGGQVAVRGQASLPGAVRAAQHLGLLDGGRALGLVVHDNLADIPAAASLLTFQVSEAGELAPLATLPLPAPAPAAAFSGNRLFAAAGRLSVVDLSNPAEPRLAVAADAAGHPDGLHVLGDAVLVFGHQESNGDQPGIEVALHDVRDPAHPQRRAQLSLSLEGYNRLVPDGDGAVAHWLVDGDRLLVLPFSAIRAGGTVTESRLQLVDVDPILQTLAIRGALPGGADSRALLTLDGGRLLAAGPHLQAIDPRPPARASTPLDLERFIMDMDVEGGYAVQLVGDPDAGNNELQLVPAADPEIAIPLATQPANAIGAQEFARAGRAYVLGVHKGQPHDTRVDLFDLAPGLRRRGSVTVPFSVAGLTVPHYDDGLLVALVGASTLALRHPPPEGARQISFVDASDPDAPLLAGTATLPEAHWAAIIAVDGTKVLVAHHADRDTFGADTGPGGRFWLTEIDAANPAQPVVGSAIETPGLPVALRGSLLYSASLASSGRCGEGKTSTLRVSRRQADGHFTVIGTLALPGVRYDNHIFVQGEAAFVDTDKEVLAIDLHDPTRPTLAGRAPLAGAWAPEAVGPGLLLSRTTAYRYDDSLNLTLERIIDAPWARGVRVFQEAGQAVVPKGKKGVEVFRLRPSP